MANEIDVRVWDGEVELAMPADIAEQLASLLDEKPHDRGWTELAREIRGKVDYDREMAEAAL